MTGYADDVVMAEMRSEEPSSFDYEFNNCLLRTPEVEDDPDSTSIPCPQPRAWDVTKIY